MRRGGVYKGRRLKNSLNDFPNASRAGRIAKARKKWGVTGVGVAPGERGEEVMQPKFKRPHS